jgi:hypothetical protein
MPERKGLGLYNVIVIGGEECGEHHHLRSRVVDPALKAISEKIGFLGVNYYERHVTLAIAGDNRRDAAFTYPGERRTAAGVGINPHRTATNPNSETAFLTSNARSGLKAVPGSPLSA